jgi:hypothetical protein
MTDPTTLSPTARAGFDFREEGVGQDHNPYSRTSQPLAWEEYSETMRKLWSGDFAQAQARAEAELSRRQDAEREQDCAGYYSTIARGENR